MSRTEQIAWAAGLFEGEGSMGYYQRTARPNGNGFVSIQLRMHERDEDVVRRFFAIVGVGIIRWGGHRPVMCCWQASGADSVRAIELLLPHLGVRRRAKAAEILGEVLARPAMARSWKEPRLPLDVREIV